MASIGEKLNQSLAGGVATKQRVKEAVAAANISALSTKDRVTRGGKEYKNVLRQYKDAIDEVQPPYVSKYEGLGYRWTEADKHAWLAGQIYSESLPFYDNNARTSILKTMLKRVSSKVMDNYSIVDSQGEEVTEVTLDLDGAIATHMLDNKNYEAATKRLLLGGTIYLVAYINEYGGIFFKVKDRYQVRPNPTGYDILYTDRGINKVERRHLNDKAEPVIELIQQDKQGEWTEIVEAPFGAQFDALDTFGVYELSIEEFVTSGTLELTLMYSQLFGTIDKELVFGALQIFADKGYTSRGLLALQDFFTPVDTPKTSVSMAEGGKPIFEVYAPTLRDSSLQALRDIVREEIATSMMLDRSSLGLDSNGATATEETIKLSNSVDTINMLKREVQGALNGFIHEFITDEYSIKVEPYQVNDTASRVTTAAAAKREGIMTIETAVRYQHPDWSDEQVTKEVISLKIENMKELTPAEREQAATLGLIEQPEGAVR